MRAPQDGRAAELAAELAALGLPKAALGDVLARRYVRGTWGASAAGAGAGLARRRFLAALPGCAGALRLAACEWAAEELGEQARSRPCSLEGDKLITISECWRGAPARCSWPRAIGRPRRSLP